MSGRKKPTDAELAHIEPAIRHLAVHVDDVEPDPQNARLHSKRNLEAVRGSLTSFRQQTPIVVDADGVVRAGNGTLAVVKALGLSWVAASRSSLRGPEAAAYGIADNRASELSQWDHESLAKLIGAMDDGLAAMTGFADFELGPLLEAEWRGKPGGGPSADDGAKDPRAKVTRKVAATAAEWRAIDEVVADVKERTGEPDDLAALARVSEVYLGASS